jgi:hypothetical protein
MNHQLYHRKNGGTEKRGIVPSGVHSVARSRCRLFFDERGNTIMEINRERCPQCFTLPDLFIETKAVFLHCPKHGHVARGRDIDEASKNWNIYIHFIKNNPATLRAEGRI